MGGKIKLFLMVMLLSVQPLMGSNSQEDGCCTRILYRNVTLEQQEETNRLIAKLERPIDFMKVLLRLGAPLLVDTFMIGAPRVLPFGRLEHRGPNTVEFALIASIAAEILSGLFNGIIDRQLIRMLPSSEFQNDCSPTMYTKAEFRSAATARTAFVGFLNVVLLASASIAVYSMSRHYVDGDEENTSDKYNIPMLYATTVTVFFITSFVEWCVHKSKKSLRKFKDSIFAPEKNLLQLLVGNNNNV